jgi:DNA-binding protein H-NS
MATKKSTYADLKAQMAALEEQLAAARAAEVEEVIGQIRVQCETYGLTAEDIFGRARGFRGSAPKVTSKAPPKYRDPETGATWTGRGKPPHWIAGKDRAQFAIN